MSGSLGPIAGIDPAAGMFAMPVWAAGAAAAIAVGLCVFAFNRAGREGLIGGIARSALLLIGAVVAWFLFEASSQRDLMIERRALDARATELTARAVMPGSALACLNAAAGETVEASCEKALFATPEATAAAVSYVSAQLALLSDASAFARRDPHYETVLSPLRRAAETDRFGIVAHVLAVRDGCTADQCSAFAMLKDASRVSTNIAERMYDFYVVRYAGNWPAVAAAPAANGSAASSFAAAPAAPAAPGAQGNLPLKPPGPNVFFPNAASIPPVNIMTAEPATAAPVQETTGSGAPPAPAAKPRPPPRRPVQAAPQVQRPVDLNAEAQRTTTFPATIQ